MIARFSRRGTPARGTALRTTRDPKLASALAQKGVQILHVGSDVLAAVSYQTQLVREIKSGLSGK